MPILFNEKSGVFNLSTENSTYLMGIYKRKLLVHLYYGKPIKSDVDIDHIISRTTGSFSGISTLCEEGERYSEDIIPLEYPTYGSTDVRTPAFKVEYEDGSTITKLVYKAHRIYDGKPELEGLASSYADSKDGVKTLEIKLYDDLKKTGVLLSYTVFEKRNIIARSVKVINESDEKIVLTKVLSMNMDIKGEKFDFIHLHGAWARERHIERRPIIHGGVYIDSKRGSSSHHHNPFFALASENTDESHGNVYGFAFVYSGNFVGGTELNSYGTTRTYMGINDINFRWNLGPDEAFQAPEVVMTFSADGFNGMSQNFHEFIRKNICRGKYRDIERPILINNWEATYFNFDEDKIMKIAKTAKELGIELLVLDDGWFGERNDDKSSLGDWFVNKKKLPNGIDGLAKKVNELGLKFGLWFEPEMVSPISELYKKHPEWAVQVKGRALSQERNQYILDLSRDDVCEYIIGFLSDILSNNPISYVKWDMNRNFSEAGSLLLPPERQQEFFHRYILGFYHVLGTITKKFPDILFEGCSGGGARFDLGALCYYPQIWLSDDTDAVERMFIQYGSSMIFPTSVMGAHVSGVPNHQVGRYTSFETRGNIAFMGRFGYELDLSKLTDEEKDIAKKQVKDYKKIGQIIHEGKMYRLLSPFDTNYFAVEFVSEDEKTVILIYSNILGQPNPTDNTVYLRGLDSDALYKNVQTGEICGGDVLSNIGMNMKNDRDFKSSLIVFERI